METYTLPAVFETPELITSLYNYSMSRHSLPPPPTTAHDGEGASPKERQSSVLFLRIYAAADYFSPNRTLMEHPEPVAVDIILDPFVLNVLPRTLVPTVGYVVFIAALAWFLSTRLILPWVRGLMVGDSLAEQQRRKEQ